MSAVAVDTIVFDIIGTVVDEQGSVLAATTDVLATSGFPDGATSALAGLRAGAARSAEIVHGGSAVQRRSRAVGSLLGGLGLSWHCVLSGSMVGSAKPNPAVYQLAIDTLQLDPERTLFVACHPWDLRAAALQGFRTAYVHRPGEAVPTESDRFDLIATDLAELVLQLFR